MQYKRMFTARRLCRAGVISALYIVLTYAFATTTLPFKSVFEIRPAEALCILPLFYPEAVPALFIGCVVANIPSPLVLYDVTFGALTTLLSAFITFFIGRVIRHHHRTRFLLGALVPVLLNALVIPVIIVFLAGDVQFGAKAASYFAYVFSIFVSEALWIYGLGAPLYYFVRRMRDRGVPSFL